MKMLELHQQRYVNPAQVESVYLAGREGRWELTIEMTTGTTHVLRTVSDLGKATAELDALSARWAEAVNAQ